MPIKINPELVFYQLLKNDGIELPIKEFQFHKTRKWRFDYAYPNLKIAIEVEGGAFTQGRHTRGKGFIEDMKKYNEATLSGWTLIRIIPDQLMSYETIKLIKRAFELIQENE